MKKTSLVTVILMLISNLCLATTVYCPAIYQKKAFKSADIIVHIPGSASCAYEDNVIYNLPNSYIPGSPYWQQRAWEGGEYYHCGTDTGGTAKTCGMIIAK